MLSNKYNYINLRSKSLIIYLLIATFSLNSWSQTILVHGNESDGKLAWTDFTGPVIENSSFQAYTSYKFRTKYESVQYDGNFAIIDGFEAILELDPEKTWAKMDKVTDELLVHEQGHFNLGILTVQEINKRVSETKFTRANLNSQLKRIIDETSRKYKQLTLKYDKETDHSKNIKQQERWNQFFLEKIAD